MCPPTASLEITGFSSSNNCATACPAKNYTVPVTLEQVKFPIDFPPSKKWNLSGMGKFFAYEVGRKTLKNQLYQAVFSGQTRWGENGVQEAAGSSLRGPAAPAHNASQRYYLKNGNWGQAGTNSFISVLTVPGSREEPP